MGPINLHDVVGASVTLLGVWTYVLYFRSIARGRRSDDGETRSKSTPHAVSWALWAVLDAVAFFGQRSFRAGPAAWLTGSTALMCAITFVIGVTLTLGDGARVRIDRGDWVTLAGATLALALMLGLPSPLLAMIAGQVTTLAGYVPTIRKVLREPLSEDLPAYVTALLKYSLAFAAVETFSPIVVGGLACAVFSSVSMCLLIWWTQRKMRREEAGRAAVLRAGRAIAEVALAEPQVV